MKPRDDMALFRELQEYNADTHPMLNAVMHYAGGGSWWSGPVTDATPVADSPFLERLRTKAKPFTFAFNFEQWRAHRVRQHHSQPDRGEAE